MNKFSYKYMRTYYTSGEKFWQEVCTRGWKQTLSEPQVKCVPLKRRVKEETGEHQHTNSAGKKSKRY